MCKTSIFNKNRNIVAARATVYMRSIEQQFFFFFHKLPWSFFLTSWQVLSFEFMEFYWNIIYKTLLGDQPLPWRIFLLQEQFCCDKFLKLLWGQEQCLFDECLWRGYSPGKWSSNQCIDSILANFHFQVKVKLSLQKNPLLKIKNLS